ncbi:MAG: hypothetical protein ACMXYG_04410 [Candidatus Woesearchaeota archaeon]
MLTLSVVALLLLSSPALAVRVNLATAKAVYTAGTENAVFTVSIDIENGEIVPIKSLLLRINDDYKVCEFDIDGSSNCPNLEIELLSDPLQVSAIMEGRGHGINSEGNFGLETTNFGYGYGFIFQHRRSNINGELLYRVEWNFTADDATAGQYRVSAEAYAEANGIEYTYTSRSPTRFNIRELNQRPVRTTILANANARSRANNEIVIGGYNQFDRESVVFSSRIRKTSLNEVESIDGTTSLTLNLQAEDGSNIRLSVRIRSSDFELLRFNDQIIEFNANASVQYTSRNLGRIIDRVLTGNRPTITFRGTVSDIYVLIENGFIIMESNNIDMPFYVRMPIDRFTYTER